VFCKGVRDGLEGIVSKRLGGSLLERGRPMILRQEQNMLTHLKKFVANESGAPPRSNTP
jgi:hypothetical protein